MGVGPALGVGLGELDGGAGDRVRAGAAGGGAVLGGTGLAAALDLVEEREQAEFAEFGEGLVGGCAGGAESEARGVGVVEVGDAVLGAVDEGDEGREPAEDLPYGELVEGGHGGEDAAVGARAGGGARAADRGVRGAAVRGRCRAGGGAAGCRDGALTPLGLGGGMFGPGGGAALRSGKTGAPAREVHCVQASWCRKWSLCFSWSVAGRCRSVDVTVKVTVCRGEPTYGHTSSVADRTDNVSPGCPSGGWGRAGAGCVCGRVRRRVRILPWGVRGSRGRRSHA